MAKFDPEINPATSHVMLMELAVGAGSTPQAYLCCAVKQNQTRVFCLHTPSCYAGSLDGQVTPWDGNCFAFLGEVTQGSVSTVDLPLNVFRTVGYVQAKTSDYIVTHLNEMGDYGLRPPIANDQDADTVTTRTIMYLPKRYVHLFLNPAGYTLKQTWELLYPLIMDNNDLVPCGALLKWLGVVSMGIVNPNDVNQLLPTTASLDLTVPLNISLLIIPTF